MNSVTWWFLKNFVRFVQFDNKVLFLTHRTMTIREVVGCWNSGKFLKKFFENQRLVQWLLVKSTKISEKNLNIWNLAEFLQKLKIFVNKNGKCKSTPLSMSFFSDIFQRLFKFFEKFLNKWKLWLPPCKIQITRGSYFIKHRSVRS